MYDIQSPSKKQMSRCSGQLEFMEVFKRCALDSRTKKGQWSTARLATVGSCNPPRLQEWDEEPEPTKSCHFMWEATWQKAAQQQPSREVASWQIVTPPSSQPLISYLCLPLARPDQNQRLRVMQFAQVTLPKYGAGQNWWRVGPPRVNRESPTQSP